MSNLVVSNISDGTTSVGTGYVVNGSAKAWVNFNGTGTVAIRDSLNVSSLTDNATGNYLVNLTNSLSSANHSGAGSTWRDGIGFGFFSTPPYTASSVYALTGTDAGTFSDNSDNSASIHGDLA